MALLAEAGFGNLGDDHGNLILRDLLLEGFRSHGIAVHIDLISRNQLGRLDNERHSIVAAGCGTLLDRVGGSYTEALRQAALRPGVIAAVLGSGDSDTRHLPPTTAGSAIYEEALANADYVWVRGEHGPDPFWAHPLPEWPAERTAIGVNMGYCAYAPMGTDAIYDKMSAIAARYDAKWVSCWARDDAWATPNTRVGGIVCSLAPLTEYKAILCTRGHLAVATALAGAQPLVVARSEKMAALFRSTRVQPHMLGGAAATWVPVLEQALVAPKLHREHVEEAGVRVKVLVDRFVVQASRRIRGG